VGGAELDRLVAFELDRVDGDHVLGAGDDRTLQRAHADAADSDDHDRLAGLNLGDVGGRAEAGEGYAGDATSGAARAREPERRHSSTRPNEVDRLGKDFGH
jgi:hypothetical protein